MSRWFKLDNAAKVFPSVSNKRRSNVFRLSFDLKEDINPQLLQEAVDITIERFKPFKVKLKKGIFWYYLEENSDKVQVLEESPFISQKIRKKDNNGYMFRVYYFNNRITVELFHSLTDGTGGLEFLKAIVFNYLVLKGHKLDSENLILTDIETTYEEIQDSYVKNFDKRIKSAARDGKALKIKGTYYEDSWISLISGTLDLEKIKAVAKSFNATITEFLCTCLIYTAVQVPYIFEKKKHPFKLVVPVNLRKVFPSKTLRNFSLILTTGRVIDNQVDFNEILESVKEDFKRGLDKDYLQSQIVANVKIEQNLLMRIVPLMIKEIVLKIGFNAWGEGIHSMSISNLGVVTLPKSMHEHVDKVSFSIGASYSSPINIGVNSFGNKLVLCFTSSIIERDFQREFFRTIANFGIEVLIETNELEV